MIKICKDRFDLFYQGKFYGHVHLEDMPDQPNVGNMHIYITRFSHNILNRMQRDESSLMKYIKKLGYKELISWVDVDTVKNGNLALWTKFIKMFGFEEPKLFTRRTL